MSIDFPVPSLLFMQTRCAAMRNRIANLMPVARHGQTLAVLATANLNLETIERRLQQQPDAAECENLDLWLQIVQQRVRAIRQSLDAYGADAAPTVAQQRSIMRKRA